MKSIPKRTLKFTDSWLMLRSQWARWPGFTVAIAKDGEVVFHKVYGLANIENNEKLTTNQPSLSHCFTIENIYCHGRNAVAGAWQVAH